MGVKRWILALSIPVVVLGLLVALFFQMGADERVIQGFLPRIESKFDIRIRYEGVSVGLTAVVFENVVVETGDGARPFARIGKLGVNVRVGPLIVGEVDVTGLRCEELELLAGEGIGATVDDWRALLERLRGLGGGVGGGAARGKVEIHVVSGSARAVVDQLALAVGSISGRMSDAGEAVLRVEGVAVKRGAEDLLVSDGNELRYKPEGRRVSVVLEQPALTVPVERAQLRQIARDLRGALARLGLDPTGAPTAAPADPPAGGAGEGLSIRVLVNDGTATLVGAAAGQKVELGRISAEIAAAQRELVTCRASGDLPGGSARWVVGATWPEGRPIALDVEIPDLPLASIGPLLLASPHVVWERAYADGTLRIQIADGRAELAGQASFSGLKINHERLAAEPLAELSASVDFKATYDSRSDEVRLERALVSRGQARATFRGVVRLDRLAFDLTVNVPPTPCRQVLAAIPVELRRDLEGVQLDGAFGLDMRLAIDEKSPPDTLLEASLDNRCRVTDFGPLPYPDDFRRPFAYTAYDPDGRPLRLVSGPGTDRWTPFSMISQYLVEAALTTEDGKFLRHDGVTLPEVQRAIELNLGKGGLAHGASTITMQLAKNLFLTRERTVRRKLEELFFTWYLETSFTKEEILELYFNVIEFGPSLYGVQDAAHHYFGREPYELDLAESVFLIKLLPSPVKRHQVYEQGEVSERRMVSLHKVMRTMLERGRITHGELQEGLGQRIDFHTEGEPLPEPRGPVQRAELAEPTDDGTVVEDEATEADWGL